MLLFGGFLDPKVTTKGIIMENKIEDNINELPVETTDQANPQASNQQQIPNVDSTEKEPIINPESQPIETIVLEDTTLSLPVVPSPIIVTETLSQKLDPTFFTTVYSEPSDPNTSPCPIFISPGSEYSFGNPAVFSDTPNDQQRDTSSPRVASTEQPYSVTSHNYQTTNLKKPVHMEYQPPFDQTNGYINIHFGNNDVDTVNAIREHLKNITPCCHVTKKNDKNIFSIKIIPLDYLPQSDLGTFMKQQDENTLIPCIKFASVENRDLFMGMFGMPVNGGTITVDRESAVIVEINPSFFTTYQQAKLITETSDPVISNSNKEEKTNEESKCLVM